MKSQIELNALYRAIPSVQDLLQDTEWTAFGVRPEYLKLIIQEEVSSLRRDIHSVTAKSPGEIPALIKKNITKRLNQLIFPRLYPVVNATGIILHTNLGRAPFPAAVAKAISDITDVYCNLEIDLSSGKRGRRSSLVEELLCLVTGAEAAFVVNNNAAAILLALRALCREKEVPISRGELVEIGGSFRMPDVMETSGAIMVEVGATNKTHLDDYEQAISINTGALLKVHTSNYRIQGFTESIGIEALALLAHKHNLPLIYDMGSGALVDLAPFNLPAEPVARAVIQSGADIITFSGDKVLGGPQAGIIVGKKEYVARIRKNPLARALRCDKMIYAALESTLRLYLKSDALPKSLPLYRMLAVTPSTLKERANAILASLNNSQIKVEIVETTSQMGSGALPLEKIPSVALRLSSGRFSEEQMAAALRRFQPPVLGYIKENAVFLNLRTVRELEIPLIAQALNSLSD